MHVVSTLTFALAPLAVWDAPSEECSVHVFRTLAVISALW